jgi:hypothetical protein
MPPPSPDSEERQLLAEYAMAAQFYSWVVGKLARQRDILSHEEYEKLGAMVDNARSQCELARRALGGTHSNAMK